MKISAAHLLQLAIRDELDFLVARINSIVRLNDANVFTEEEASDVLDAILDANSELNNTLTNLDYEYVKPETQPQPANKPQTPDKQPAGVRYDVDASSKCPLDTKEAVVTPKKDEKEQYYFSGTNKLLKEMEKAWHDYLDECNKVSQERNKPK